MWRPSLRLLLLVFIFNAAANLSGKTNANSVEGFLEFRLLSRDRVIYDNLFARLICTLRSDLKGTQIFIGCYLRIFRVTSTQIFFPGDSLKKVGCRTYKSEKNQVSSLKKNG